MANHDLRHLHNSELSAPLVYQLRPFISSYRTHDQPPTKKDLDQDDYIPKESVVGKDCILDTYKAIIHSRDLSYLKYKREYNNKWRGYRTWYNL